MVFSVPAPHPILKTYQVPPPTSSFNLDTRLSLLCLCVLSHKGSKAKGTQDQVQALIWLLTPKECRQPKQIVNILAKFEAWHHKHSSPSYALPIMCNTNEPQEKMATQGFHTASYFLRYIFFFVTRNRLSERGTS